ncbi:transmembrane and immunoglobulin domain-containing protein 1 isoform X1 [Engystomops pustulosus]|uniref:transmembrane and immunoglobulin domain-containing protein 1 isoform X1 n=1 Tax=Engystomops pustulosus TaxID=76066 RepID=UPI003AFA0A17
MWPEDHPGAHRSRNLDARPRDDVITRPRTPSCPPAARRKKTGTRESHGWKKSPEISDRREETSGTSPLHVNMKKLLLLVTVLLPFFHEITGSLKIFLNNALYENKTSLTISDPAIIRCEVADNTENETLIWYRGTLEVNISSENSVNVSTVCIPELTVEDNGVSFTCLLKSNTSIKRSLQLDVQFNPRLSGDTQIRAEEGKTVQISCGFKANPAASMFWRQNNSLFTLPANYKQDLTTDTLQLTIEKVTKKDTANYTCVALLPNGGETTRVFELIVGDRQVGLPIEAIAAAVVVGALMIAFGMFARREKIFNMCMKGRHDTAM